MDQQPDKLFRDKLKGYDPAVPTQVWSRVASNVEPKRRFTWWASAAAVVLIGSAVLLLYPLKEESAQLAGNVAEPRKEQSPITKTLDDSLAESGKGAGQKESVAPAPSAEKNSDEHPSPKKSTAPAKQEQYTMKTEDLLPVIAMPVPEPIVIAQENVNLSSASDETLDQSASDRKTITIVYSAEEVNEKYLSKSSQVHATSGEEEASRLKNMLDKAYDLTHNQSPLGELRQKKNEILAMNFRKDKSGTQND